MDTVTLDRSEYSAEEGNRVVGITLYRTGDMLDSITVPFRVQAILGAENAAIRKYNYTARPWEGIATGGFIATS